MTVDVDSRVAPRARRGVTSVLLLAALVAASVPARAQASLTLEDAMRRAQETTADARILAASVAEADAGARRARAGFWPRIDASETVQRGNQPVFVFSSLLAQRRFSDANFAIPALNRPDAISNTRTTLSIQQPIFDDRIGLDVGAAALGRDLASAHRETARQDLAFEAARAFVRVLELDAATHAAQAAVDAAESDRDRARARRDVGLATDADVLAVDVHLADVRQQQIAASGDLIVARLQLADVVGLPLTTTFALVRPAPRSMPGMRPRS
jgi:outer membrane protein TolC